MSEEQKPAFVRLAWISETGKPPKLIVAETGQEIAGVRVVKLIEEWDSFSHLEVTLNEFGITRNAATGPQYVGPPSSKYITRNPSGQWEQRQANDSNL